MTIHQVLESLIFASPKPITTAELVAALKATGESSEKPEAQDFAQTDEERVLAVLGELQQQVEDAGRAFHLQEQVNGWVFVSRPEYAPWVRQLFPEAKPTRLSGPALETLAISAYRQPVTRADIEAVRGVAVDGVMQVLLDRSLVRISGRADVPGRPLLYSTTGYFLEHFGLKSVHELPNSEELRRAELPKAPVPEEKSAAKGKRRKGEGESPELGLAAGATGPSGTEAVPAPPSQESASSDLPVAGEEGASGAQPPPEPEAEASFAIDTEPDEVSSETPESTQGEVVVVEPVEERVREPVREPVLGDAPGEENTFDHEPS
jgi:segregation and condensation protein B